jgi:hypothetical protein
MTSRPWPVAHPRRLVACRLVKTRHAARAAVLAAAVPLLTLTASPAFAVYRDDGDDPGAGIGPFETLLLYVVVPLAVFALLALFVYAGSIARGPRYRPDLGWWASPVWFEGPEGGAAVLASAPAEQVTTDGGGASARW